MVYIPDLLSSERLSGLIIFKLSKWPRGSCFMGIEIGIDKHIFVAIMFLFCLIHSVHFIRIPNFFLSLNILKNFLF